MVSFSSQKVITRRGLHELANKGTLRDQLVSVGSIVVLIQGADVGLGQGAIIIEPNLLGSPVALDIGVSTKAPSRRRPTLASLTFP